MYKVAHFSTAEVDRIGTFQSYSELFLISIKEDGGGGDLAEICEQKEAEICQRGEQEAGCRCGGVLNRTEP